MELKDIVAVSGQGGLHKIIGRTKNGLILETIGMGKRFATSYQDKVSVLEDISMYTVEGDLHLAQVLVKIHDQGGVPTPKDDAKNQRQYLVDTIQLDSERVYDSDIKKLITWYASLKDVLDFAKLAEEKTEELESAEENKEIENVEGTGDEKPKKALAKKVAPKKAAAKTAQPKATKVSSKSAANTNTYRPKSV
ncbi:MAG: DUF5606 domain-containing protein [Bacteroidetes bacterium]|nr:DUF5606 domain-containing protein [Bacteroidota bacterium]